MMEVERGNEEDDRRWFLEYIDLENFKSYAGKVKVGPLKDFIAVIGPNGSGKSNLLDAISFVTGEKSASLRVRRLNELIHGAAVGKPVASTASVTATFKIVSKEGEDEEDEDESRKTFSRIIRGSSSEYVYNGAVVPLQKYLEELNAIGIYPKAKNFLVFQGAIENIAMKSAKERTALLEETCGSAALKDEYEKAKVRMTEADQKTETVYGKKKKILAERKGVRLEMQQATAYQELLKEMNDKEQELAIFKLYYLDDDITRLESRKIMVNNREVKGYRKLKAETEEALAELRRERGELNRALVAKETANQKQEKERDRKAPKDKLFAVQQKVKHLEKKLASAEKSLKQAKDNKKVQGEDLKRLCQSLEEAKKREEDLLQSHNGDSLRVETGGNLDVSFQDSQFNEYWELKQKVMEETSKEIKAKESIERKCKDKNELFTSLTKQKKDLEVKIDLLKNELELKKKLASKLHDAVQNFQSQIKSKEGELGPIRETVVDAEKRKNALDVELEKIRFELASMQMDQKEIEQMNNKAEVLTALSQRFKGVIDRVRGLCKPRHARYRNAITKLMGGLMEAIVVDTEKTARDCIQYLKEQMLRPETFLALDFIVVEPVKDRYRSSGEKEKIQLAIDLLNYDKRAERAIQYCMKNAVVCETPELASKVANGNVFNGQRTNAVSLDGTMFYTNGIISGGLADLERKARKWNDEDLRRKEERKDKVMNEISEALRAARRRGEIDDLELELDGLKTRLKHAHDDLKNRVKDIRASEKQLEVFETELNEISTRWDNAKSAVHEAKSTLEEVQKEIDAKEDSIFASFCDQVGIPSIRAYEERDLKAQEEFKRKREEIANEIERTKANIEFEKDNMKSLDENIERWNKCVADVKKTIKESQAEEKRMLEVIGEFEKELAKRREEIDNDKLAIDEKDDEIKTAMKNLTNYSKALLKAQKTLSHLETCIMQKKSEKRDLMRHSRLNGVDIPLKLLPGVDSDGNTLTAQPDPLTPEELEGVWEEQAGREDEFDIDYSKLDDDLKTFGDDANALKQAEENLQEKLRDVEVRIAKIEAPNLKAKQKWEAINKKTEEMKKEFDEVRKEATAARSEFHKVKEERTKKFNECFKKIANNIDGIYKALTQNNSAQAILDLDNCEEPYLGGVSYHCVAPGKRFQPMSNMSGGEKTLAALALLFAIHSFQTSPFFILDEIDAALDNTNIAKVSSFFRGKRKEMQVVVISLKEEFFQHADSLFGIAPSFDVSSEESASQSDCSISKVYSLDLTPYDNCEA